MRSIVFMGTPEVARIALQAIHMSFPIGAVVTQPDRPRSRGLKNCPPPVKVLALEKGLKIAQPSSSRDRTFIEWLKTIRPDLIVVVAYGGLLNEEVINIPRLGCINLHSSLLPKYRGATPVQWAVMNGEIETGWTTFYISKGMDSGDIILQRSLSIDPEDDADKLFLKMIPLGVELLVETIHQVFEGSAPRIKQNSQTASFAPRLKKGDGLIDWNQYPSSQTLVNRIRGLIPWPVAHTFLVWKGKRMELRIFKAVSEPVMKGEPGLVMICDKNGLLVGTGEGAIWLKEVQLEGSRRMSIEDFLRGHALSIGTRLG